MYNPQRRDRLNQVLSQIQSGGSSHGSVAAVKQRAMTVGGAIAPYMEPTVAESVGPLQQFMEGIGSPVTSTLAKLGAIDRRPRPFTTGEKIAHGIGSLIGWIGLGWIGGAALGAVGIGVGATGAAAGGVGAMGSLARAAVSPLAKRATSAAAVKAIEIMGTSTLAGAAYGAHTAWVEDRRLAPEVLKGAAFGAVMGGVGLGVGKLAEKMKITKPTAGKLVQEHFAQRPILDPRNPASVVKTLSSGDLLQRIPQSRLERAVEESSQLAQEALRDLPSSISPNDVGIKFGSAFDKLNPQEQAVALVEAFQNSSRADTILEPILDVARVVEAPGSILKGKIINFRHGYARDIIKAASPAEIKVSEETLKMLPKGQQNIISEMSSKKATLGSQFEHFEQLRRNVRAANNRILKKHNVKSLSELVKVPGEAAEKAAHRYAKSQEMLQDMTWQLGDQVSKAAHGHPSVNLPSLHAVQSTQAAETYLEVLKKEGDQVTGLLDWHPQIQEIIKKHNDGNMGNFTDLALMPPELRDKVQAAIKQLKAAGDSPKTFRHGLISFGVPEDVLAKDIPKFIQDATELPAGSMFTPLSVHDSLMVQTSLFRPLPVLGRVLTPIRYALGEGFTNQARVRVQKHQKFVDNFATKIEGYFKYLGIRPGKEATAVGVRLTTGPLEGRVMPEFEKAFVGAGSKIVSMRSEPTVQVLSEIARETGTPIKFVKETWQKIYNIQADPKRLKAFQSYASATGITLESFATQHLVSERLRMAGRLSGEAAESAAKMFGLKNAKELKVASEIRKEYDKLFRASGMDPEMYLPGYAPRFRERIEGKTYEEIVRMFRDKGVPEKEIQGYLFMNEMSRHTKGIGYKYEKDAFRALSRYVSGYSKSVHYGDDFFEPWVKHFHEIGMSDERMRLLADLRHYLVGRPGEVEKQTDSMINSFVSVLNTTEWNRVWGERPTAALSSLLAELQVMGGLGFNPFSAVKNLTQKALALSSITDDGNPLHGLKWMAKAQAEKLKMSGKLKLSHCDMLSSRVFHEGLTAHHSSMGRVAKNLGAPEWFVKLTDKTSEASMAMFKRADLSNVEDTWLARLLYLTEAKGAPFSDAANMATQTAMATQFMYGFDSPMLYKTPIGRQAGIFMSWPVNWAFLLYNQGTSGDVRRAISTVVTMAVSAELLTLTGINFMSIHPVNTARGIWPIALMEGEDSWPIAFRTGAAIHQYSRALLNGDPEATDAALDNLKNRLKPMVPAGVIGSRVVNFVDIVKNDWKAYDKRDRLKYEVSKSEAIRGLFAPTRESYERVKDWQRVSRMDGYYRHTRKKAIDAYMNQDFDGFLKLQEQLLFNFGQWISPQDIRYERRLQNMTARERQMISLPRQMREPLSASLYRQ